jgi:Ca-activated chloride channel family protein
MTFHSPAWLFGLLALPVLVLLEAWLTSRDRERAARLVARPLWARVVRRPGEGLRYVRLSLLILGGAGLLLALAGPEWGIVREKVEREGVDVVLALDTSGSMATEDVSPNRFFLAKSALTSLVARLEGDRFGLLAFEGEAYPLVPLTLDADALGLFLETLEPGIVPAPGSSLGIGLAKGLDMFVDKGRQNKVMVLVSDGEDLEGEVEASIARAKQAGVVVHTVGVGSPQGQPVPDFDRQGNRVGFKKDEKGSAVVSRLHAETLEAIARGTGGVYAPLTTSGAGLQAIASAIEGMEAKTLQREWSYRKRERYQIPLGVALACVTLALLLPFPLPRREAAAVVLLCAAALPVRAQEGRMADELLLRPRRFTEQGRQELLRGNHPAALNAFEQAARTRPDDPALKFNLADGLYKNGKHEEAGALYRALSGDAASPLSADARYNLGNSLYQKQDFPGAVAAYKDSLRARPGDADTTHNLEMALRALQKQQQEQKQQQQQKDDKKQDQKQKPDDQKQDQQKQDQQKQDQQKGQPSPSPQPKSEEEKEKERFQKETGMPKERAMQLLDALQQNEKAEQKKLLAEKKAVKKTGKDW